MTHGYFICFSPSPGMPLLELPGGLFFSFQFFGQILPFIQVLNITMETEPHFLTHCLTIFLLFLCFVFVVVVVLYELSSAVC